MRCLYWVWRDDGTWMRLVRHRRVMPCLAFPMHPLTTGICLQEITVAV